MNFKILSILFFAVFVTACADSVDVELNKDFGPEQVRERELPPEDILAKEYREQVQPIIENRCVVCHGCYDAPCQLKLSSPEGIQRGMSKEVVYDGDRLFAADPTRLFIDAHSTEAWRQKGFYSILNERDQTKFANLEDSIMYQMLLQKEQFPQQTQGILPEEFNYELNQEDQCPNMGELRAYQTLYPLAGMPYGLPNLSSAEFKTLESWIGRGAPMSQPLPLSEENVKLVEEWEQKLNGNSLKERLIARYIYEHLFLAHIYFDALPINADTPPRFFKLMRSTTPPGEPINVVATRLPYDDPKVERVYYRLVLDLDATLSKTNLPYVFNQQRAELWDKLFYKNDFEVTALPGYADFNPFVAFHNIPVNARYDFMLQDAYFTIDGFIKGAVCRGQIAVDVIDDKFWVFFMPPDIKNNTPLDKFVFDQATNLRLPEESNDGLDTWSGYSKGEHKYVKARNKFIQENIQTAGGLTLDDIWSGNENAALTVFRNVDNATVVKGLLGKQPKTVWVIDYPILERIHYLLVAGFDVFGNVEHQLSTRLYMDFLRIESEANFISFLPIKDRKAILASWYIDATKELSEYLDNGNLMNVNQTGIKFETDNSKKELLSLLKHHVYDKAMLEESEKQYEIPEQDVSLRRLNDLKNEVVLSLPPVTFILVEGSATEGRAYTLIRNNAHKNVSSLLDVKDSRLPLKDTAEIFKGFIGAYPSLIFRVPEEEKANFANLFVEATDDQKFEALITRYGIRRSNPDFWTVSDRLHQLYLQQDPVEYGLFDYNRLINK